MTAIAIAPVVGTPPISEFKRRAALAGLAVLDALVLFASKFVNTGVTKLLDWADGTASNTHTEYFEWGTNSTAAAVTDTGNGTAGAEARVAATSRTRTTTTVTNDTFTWTGTISASGGSYPRTYKEVALFTAITSGTCLIHANHTDATVNQAGDNVPYTITLQLTTA